MISNKGLELSTGAVSIAEARDSTPPTSGVVSSPLFRGDGGPGYWINEAAGLGVTFPGPRRMVHRVARISPEAIWFTPGGRFNFSVNQPVSVHLAWNGVEIGPLRGRVVPLNRRGDAPYVGFRVTDVSLAVGRKLLVMLNELIRAGAADPVRHSSPVQEEIVDPARIRAVMGALVSVGDKGAVLRQSRKLRIRMHRVDPAADVVAWDSAGAWGEGPHEIDVIGYNSVYRLSFDRAEVQDGRVVTPMPTRMSRVRHRWFRRGAVGSADLRVAYQHPLWAELPRVEREIRDISFGGICFTTSPEDDMAFPGLLIPELRVASPSGEIITLCGEVRAISPARGEDPAVCGMSVTPSSPEDEVRWMRLVTQTLYPNTRTSEEHTEPLWSLFEDAGYFNLAGKSTEYFTELKKGFVDVGQRAANAPHLICQAVWPSSRGIEASVSFLKPYQHSWMGHQLAKRPGRLPDDAPDPGQIMRDIYLRAFEHPQADPTFHWMIGYIEPSVSWMIRAHLEFAKRFMDTGEALAMPMRMMKASCADRVSHAGDGLEVGLATDAEKRLLCGVIAETRPACYAESHDLVPSRLDLAEPTSAWQGVGFQRAREILVARRGGRPIAAIIMETGELGTNLFCLLDSTRVFALAPDGKDAYPRLLDEARAWYSAAGRESFLFLREDEDESYADAARITSVSPAALWVISSSLLPDFLEHVCELTGRRKAG